MYRRIFTARTAHVKPSELDNAMDELAQALHDEFPGLFVTASMKADDFCAFTISFRAINLAGAMRLDGWGHGWLVLEEVK
jgi:hypothetical protein